MLAFNFKSIFKFTNQIKQKIILLSHENSSSKYTFLAVNLSGINSVFAATCSQANSQQLTTFMKALNEHRFAIKQMQGDQYDYRQLNMFENNQNQGCRSLGKYRTEIIQLKDKYQILIDHITKNLKRQNLLLWIQVCSRLDIIQSTIWSKIFTIIIENFNHFTFEQQVKIIKYTHDFIKGKFISFTYAPTKYLYRENYLVDITNFRKLLKLFTNCIVKSQSNDESIKQISLQRVNDLLDKICKVNVINFLELTQMFNQNKQFYEKMVRNSSTEILIEILRYLSILGVFIQKIYLEVEEKILQKWLKIDKSLNQKNIAKLLAVWGNVRHHNKEIFQKCIKPFIEDEIDRGNKSRLHSIWLFNIAASNIKNFQFLERFSSKILSDLPMSNKYIHIVSHYLAVLQNYKRSDSFPTCRQHPLIQKIIQKNAKTYHNCMQHTRQEKQPYKNHLTVMNSQGAQINPFQEFWLQAAYKAFQILSKRYPHVDNCIHANFSFCVFQIDAMIMLGGKAVAFEYAGSFYNLKDQNAKITSQASGKKMMKHVILQGYGIRILEINSTNLIQRNINSFADKQSASRYILGKLQGILSDEKK